MRTSDIVKFTSDALTVWYGQCLQILNTAQLLQLPFSFWSVICFGWFLNGLIIYYPPFFLSLSSVSVCFSSSRITQNLHRGRERFASRKFSSDLYTTLWRLPSPFVNPLLPSFRPSVFPSFCLSVLLGIKSCCVAQAGIKLLGTSVLPVSVSQVMRVTYHHIPRCPSFKCLSNVQI